MTKQEGINVVSGFRLVGGEPRRRGRYTKTNKWVKPYFLLKLQVLLVASYRGIRVLRRTSDTVEAITTCSIVLDVVLDGNAGKPSVSILDMTPRG